MTLIDPSLVTEPSTVITDEMREAWRVMNAALNVVRRRPTVENEVAYRELFAEWMRLALEANPS